MAEVANNLYKKLLAEGFVVTGYNGWFDGSKVNLKKSVDQKLDEQGLLSRGETWVPDDDICLNLKKGKEGFPEKVELPLLEFKQAQYSIKQTEKDEKYFDAYVTVDPIRKTFYFNSPADIGKYTKKALKALLTREGYKQTKSD